MRDRQPDRHAESREHKRRKRRYGMQVTGQSVKLLAALLAQSSGKRAKRLKRGREPGIP